MDRQDPNREPDSADARPIDEPWRLALRSARIDASIHETWRDDLWDPGDLAPGGPDPRDHAPRIAPDRILETDISDAAIREPRRLPPRWILGSLCVHALITLTAVLFRAPEPPPDPLQGLEVYNVSADAIPAEMLPSPAASTEPAASDEAQQRVTLPHGQMVRLAPPSSPEPPLEQARYLAADDHRVAQETRSREWQVNPDVVAARASKLMREETEGGTQSISGGSTTPRTRVAMVPETPDRTSSRPGPDGATADESGELSGAGESASTRAPDRRINLFPHPGQVAALLGGGGPGAQGFRAGPGGPRSGAPDNDVIDAPDGDETRVNARAFAWEKFFSALRRQFNYYYTQAENNLDYRDIDHRLSTKNYVTTFTVSFLADGKVDDVRVLHSSGVEAFDALVVTALRNGSPFPRPPPELLDAEGRLTVPGSCTLGYGMGVPSFDPIPRYGRR